MERSDIQKTNDIHKYSDRDSSRLAQHHTLGARAHQASPGDHTHTGDDGSLQLPQIEANYDSHIQTGSTVVTFATSTSYIATVTLPTMPAAPNTVLAIVSSGASATAGWVPKTDNYTTTSFRLVLNGPSAAWSNVIVRWVAFYD